MVSSIIASTKLLFIWFNRPKPYYFEYLHPSVILVAVEEINGVVMPSEFCWAKDVHNVFFCANPHLISGLHSSWIRNIESLHTVRAEMSSTFYATALNQITSLPTGTKAIIIASGKTIAQLNRTAFIWADSPNLKVVVPIKKPSDARAEYLAL